MSSAVTKDLHREVLANGVTLLVQRRTVAPAAAQATLMRAGFLDEPDHLVGVSHVLEHMLFKGTAQLGPGELARQTKALGGALNAYTAYNRTVYYASMPARHALAVGALQADQIQRSIIDPDELRSELGVIIQEARRKLDSPGAVAGETLHRLLYAEHRLRRWRIGYEAELEAFTRDDVFGYYTSRYRPDRTVVSLVADLDVEEALDALRAEWSDWQGAPEEIPSGPPESSFPSNQTERFEREMTRAELSLGWRAPGSHHPDARALELASALLSQGRGARLTRQLRDPGLVGAVGSAHYGTVDIGVFAVSADFEPDNLTPVVQGIGGAVRSLGESPPHPTELDRVRAVLRARYQRSLERYESRAVALAAAEAEGDVTRLDRMEDEWMAVTPVQIRDVVRRYLTPEGLSGVIAIPHNSSAVFDPELIRSALQRSHPSALVSTAKIEPEPLRGKPVRLPMSHGVYHLRCDNLDILCARHDAVPQTVLAWYGSGPQAETTQTAGLAALAVRSMLRGTVDRGTTELAVAMEALGGSISPMIGADYLGMSTIVLAEHAGAAAALLAEVLTSPRLAEDAVAIEQRVLLEDARAVEDDMLRFPVQLMLGQAFKDAGYGAPMLGTPDSLAALNADRVRAWHRDWLHRSRGTLIAVGPGDPAALADILASAVGQWEVHDGEWSAQGSPRGTLLSPVAGARKVRRERQQSALAMLFPGPARNAADRFAADVWASIAGGLGGRLFESLRSQRSLAYTVIASAWQRRRAGGLLTYIAMAPERLFEARDAMLEELARFRDEPPSIDEVSRATAMLIGQEEIARQTAGAFAGAIADAWLLGDGLSELDDPGAPYRSVTGEEVHRVAATAFATLEHAEGVVEATPGE